MKTFLIFSITFLSTLCLTPQEKEEIKRLINDDNRYRKSKPHLNIISQTLEHFYFGDHFSNFKKILGAGADGIVLEVDFKLFSESPQTIPVGLKINYTNLDSTKEKLIKNYLNLMVKFEDQSRNEQGDGHVVFDLSKHYQKMLDNDVSFKNDVPFISMIYEAAIIPLKDMEDDSGKPKFVSVTVTQLGFSDIEGSFLQKPYRSNEIMNQNSVNVARMIVEISYGLWRIHENGFIHADIHSDNIIVAGNPNNLYPMIIDFDRIINQDDFLTTAFPIKEEMLNKSNPEYSEYLKYVGDPNYLMVTDKMAIYFPNEPFKTSTVLTSEWQEKMPKSTQMFIANVKYNVDTENLIYFFRTILNELIKKKLISKTNENIEELTKEINLIKKQLLNENKYLTSQELFEKLNESSGLNLTESEFHFVNEDLDNYLKEIESSRTSENDSQNTTNVKQVDVENDERIILV
jgi:hypothetical protein